MGYRSTKVEGSLMAGLEHYWPLNEASGTRYAAVGSGSFLHMDSLTGAPSGGEGKFGAATVQSTSTALTSTNTLTLGNRDFTYACWVRPTTVGSPQYTMGNWQAPFVALLYLNTTGPKWEWYVQNDAQTSVLVGPLNLGVPVANVWQLVFGWHDSVGDLIGGQIFIETTGAGSIVTGATAGVSPETSALVHRFGYTGGGNSLIGNICDAAIWGRVLTLEDRTWLFNRGRGRKFPWRGPYDIGSQQHDR